MDESIVILWKCYKEKNDNYYRDKLISIYKPFLKGIVGKIHRNMPRTVDIMDLENYAFIGLIDAIKKFDFNRKNKFETYANYRIKGAIIDGIRKQDWLSRTLRSRVRKNDEECYDDSNCDNAGEQKTYNEFENFSMLSIDDPNYFEKNPSGQSNYENNDYNLYISGTTDFAEKIENKLFLKKAISKLTAQEKRIIYLYYFKGKTFKEIGKLLNITESRISQINKKMMFTLKKELNASTMVGVA